MKLILIFSFLLFSISFYALGSVDVVVSKKETHAEITKLKENVIHLKDYFQCKIEIARWLFSDFKLNDQSRLQAEGDVKLIVDRMAIYEDYLKSIASHGNFDRVAILKKNKNLRIPDKIKEKTLVVMEYEKKYPQLERSFEQCGSMKSKECKELAEKFIKSLNK